MKQPCSKITPFTIFSLQENNYIEYKYKGDPPPIPQKIPMTMEPIEGSETSAIRTKTPGNYPKENILHIEHGESLKSKTVQSNETPT